MAKPDQNEAARQRSTRLERHRKHCAELAQKHAEMLVEERRLADDLKEFRKSIDDLVLRLADHCRTDPNQQELGDIIGDDEKPVGKDAAAGR